MKSKERVRTALSKMLPDRVPIYADFVPEVTGKLMDVMKIFSEPELSIALGNDMIMTAHGICRGYFLKDDEEYTCEWGCKWKYFSNGAGRHPEIVNHPLENDEDGILLKQYRIPDPYEDTQYEGLRQIIRKFGEDYWIVGALTCSIFDAAWYLRGMQTFMEDLYTNKDYANELINKVIEYPLAAGRKLAELGVDMIWLGDDVGMQQGMLISPDLWREVVKPRIAMLIKEFKKVNSQVKIAYHSCGDIRKIIPDFIEIGLDVLNPIQPLSMNPAVLKDLYGDNLSFWGSVDVQETLPKGTKDEIRNEVELRMKTIGKGGGLILSPAHTIQADTSVENVLAFYEAAREFGRY
jgi:uroporphyrinogen decarboxylase